MAQSIKTAGEGACSFSSLIDTVSVALFLWFGIVIMALLSHFSPQSVLTGRLTTSECVDSSGSGIDEISHIGRMLVDTCKIPSLSEGTKSDGHDGRPGQEEETRGEGVDSMECMMGSYEGIMYCK